MFWKCASTQIPRPSQKPSLAPALPLLQRFLANPPFRKGVFNLQPYLSPNCSLISLPCFSRPCPLSDLALPGEVVKCLRFRRLLCLQSNTSEQLGKH